MRPPFRRAVNAAFDPARTERYLSRVGAMTGTPGFRLAETPIFIDDTFLSKARAAAGAVLTQLSVPATLAELERAVPVRFDVPGRDALPHAAVVDCAVTRGEDGSLEPKLVELQGFPSLVAFESVQGDAWIEALSDVPGCAGPWSYADGGRDGLLALARATIVGDCDPHEVVLLDLEPAKQKTLCDFRATERLLGVAAVDPRELDVRGGRVTRRDARGRTVPVRRIYNRLILEEVERAGRALPWDPREPLDVTWVAHPNWYFLWSKVALPFLEHPSVPDTRLVSTVDLRALELSRYVLKPLFSFAGGGVVLEPGPADLEAIAPADRHQWCLQERIIYDEAIATPEAGVKLEVRLMYLRPDGEKSLRYATNLCRLSRGAMIGVDYNRDLPWTGSSIGLTFGGPVVKI